MKKALAVFLALCCVFAFFGCKKMPTAADRTEEYSYSFSPTQEAAATEPTTTEPATTEPAATEPSTTEPAATAPPTTGPAATAPASTVPQTTVPPPTVPPTTVQPVTAPPPTVPPTTAQPATAPPTTQPGPVCTVEIRCDTVLDNLSKLKKNKTAFVPSGGVILPPTQVALEPGDTVFDVLRRACAGNVCAEKCAYCRAEGIQLEYTFTPGLNTYYIEGIHQLYEKDCGVSSGWMYSVNGDFPNVGADGCPVSEGDRIVFAFTCDMGEDIGNHYIGN